MLQDWEEQQVEKAQKKLARAAAKAAQKEQAALFPTVHAVTCSLYLENVLYSMCSVSLR